MAFAFHRVSSELYISEKLSCVVSDLSPKASKRFFVPLDEAAASTIRCPRKREMVSSRRKRTAKFRFKLYYASTTFPLRFPAGANGKTGIIIAAEKAIMLLAAIRAVSRYRAGYFGFPRVTVRGTRE